MADLTFESHCARLAFSDAGGLSTTDWQNAQTSGRVRVADIHLDRFVENFPRSTLEKVANTLPGFSRGNVYLNEYTASALSCRTLRFSTSVIWKRHARCGSSKSQCG